MVEQLWWNSSGGTVVVEQIWGTVRGKQLWWKSNDGTVVVEQLRWNSNGGTVVRNSNG